MSQNEMIFMIVGVMAAVCMVISCVKRPVHSLFLAVRGIFHILLLYGIELICLKFGWEKFVVVNAGTAFVSGILGVPGIVLLYLVQIYFL
jgi:pro-sigmaK processing inhibitor BofA